MENQNQVATLTTTPTETNVVEIVYSNPKIEKFRHRGSKQYMSMFKFRRRDYCFCCDGGDGIVLHHLTYENVPEEQPEDLISVCGRCHGRLHSMDRGDVPLLDSHIVLRKELHPDESEEVIRELFQQNIEQFIYKYSLPDGEFSWYDTYMSIQRVKKISLKDLNHDDRIKFSLPREDYKIIYDYKASFFKDNGI